MIGLDGTRNLLHQYGLEVNIEKLAPDGIAKVLEGKEQDQGGVFIADYEDAFLPAMDEFSAIDPSFRHH